MNSNKNRISKYNRYKSKRRNRYIFFFRNIPIACSYDLVTLQQKTEIEKEIKNMDRWNEKQEERNFQ